MRTRTPARPPRPFRLVAAAFAAVLALAACADDTDNADQAASNDADIAFMQGMIPHHEQAIEMAELIDDRTDRTELTDLGDAITASQEAEITEMRDRLAEAGEDPDDAMSMGDMDHEDMDMDMEGMMSAEQMDDLRAASDEEFDRLFIEMMVGHHEGAISSAEDVREQGANPEVAELAEDIIAEQEAEIGQMREWQQEWDLG